MINETILINSANDGWIKGVSCLIPNLQVGQTIKLMASKEMGYAQTIFRIDGIETTIGSDTDTIIQHVMVTAI